ncbi:WbuC family cupin fold metalloprotein [Iodobacter ciconiae]|uniref:Cupin fold metalloprotein, WbuC family n=1 Tax=Iodobacter ciconiae TaxID=2496266 RepID=A0A3S8ZNF0_9NEIS|nr:WbuC family cupin fold metalloprotein [Iodobacter ciconiae]AZN35016.1 cupin fold metalloprotein, WbuC family [Iodobacter ciconiae]
MISVINSDTLSDLSAAAKTSPRLRKNQNFHASNESACHRLLNALEPGTYVQPHRHLDAEKDETMIALSGRFGVLIFDEAGEITEQAVLAADGNLGINIPAGTFHSMVALESGSVFFESKAGPYVPLGDSEKASWAPAEGEPGCEAYLAKMVAYFNIA